MRLKGYDLPLPRTVRGLLVMLLLVILLPSLVVQGLLVYRSYEQRRQERFESNLEVARAVQAIFSNYIEAVGRQQSLVAVAMEDHELADPLITGFLRQANEQQRTMKGMAFASPEGLAVAASDESLLGVNVSDREYFQQAVKAAPHEVVLSDLIIDRSDGLPTFTISQPVFDRQGGLRGVLVAIMDPTQFGRQALEVRRLDPGLVLLFDRTGRLVHRDPWLGFSWEERAPELWHNAAMSEALAGIEGAARWRSPGDGVERMVVRVPVARWGWVVGTGYPVRRFDAAMLRSLAFAGGLNMLVLLASLLVALLMANRLSHAFRGLQEYVERFDPRQPMPAPVPVRRVRELDELAESWQDAVGRRQDAENRLREARDTLRNVIESTPDFVVAVDRGCHFLAFNDGYRREFQRLFGRDVTIGENMLDALSGTPDDQQVLKKTYARALTGESFTITGEFGDPSRERREYEISYAPIYDEQNQVVGATQVARDVTERRKREAILRRYELLAAHSRDVILFVRLNDGQILEANAAASEVYGYTHDELLGMQIHQLRTDLPEEVARQMQQADGDSGTRFETVHRRRDGSRFPVEVTSRGADIGGERVLLSVIRDITQRKEAEGALRENEARLRFVLENSPDHTFIQDRHLCYLWWGKPIPPAEREELTGKRDEDLFSPADAERLTSVKQQVIDDGEAITAVLPLTIDGQERMFEARLEPWRDWHGNIIGLAGYMRDVTEARRWAESLQQMTDELRRSNEDLEQFAYVASHDLQEPLRMVTGFLDLLRTRYGEQFEAKAMEYLSMAHDGAVRMQRLILDLLEFSRVTTRGQKFKPASMQKALEEALARLAGAIHEAEAEVTYDELPDVVGDQAQLTQVLQNLVGNAIKFRHDQRKPVIHVGFTPGPRMTTFYVRDNGIGINPRHHERIFLIFQRLHSRSEYAGTGIGLAVVKKIIERHGGTICIESEAGSGTTFFFVLPNVP